MLPFLMARHQKISNPAMDLSGSGGVPLPRQSELATDSGLRALPARCRQRTQREAGNDNSRIRPTNGYTPHCLFQHFGSQLRVGYGLDGDLPTDLTTGPGYSRYLATHPRENPSAAPGGSGQPTPDAA